MAAYPDFEPNLEAPEPGRHERPAPANTRPHRAGTADDPALAYLADDPAEGRRLRVAIAVAVLVHCLLLAVPTLRSEAGPAEPEDERSLVELKPVRFKPPPPPPPEAPPEEEPQAVEIAVPERTPEEIEPLRPIEVPVAEIPFVDDLDDWDWELVPEPPPEADSDPGPDPDVPVFVGGEIDRPVGIHTPEPRYTELARRARIQGPVILQVTLDRRGEVGDVKVLRGLPAGLTESAERTVREWRYHPATLNGKPVSVYMTITIHFQLN